MRSSLFLPLLVGVLTNLLAAVVTARSRPRRILGVAISLASMGAAWWVPPDHTLLRPIWALAAFIGVMRTIDLTRGSWSLGARLVHVTSVVDTRRLVRAAPFFDRVAFAAGVAWLLSAGIAYLGVIRVGPPVEARGWLVRWALGLVFVYSFSAGAFGLASLFYRAIGFVTPPLHRAPARARSVQEFWGERWNRIVSRWLGETFFRPLARRRRPALGAFLAFLVSALLHAYLAWIGVGLTMALSMLAFFVLQAFLIALERRLSVRAWAPWSGHAWTVAWVVSLSPLFDEPLVRVLGP